MRVAEFEAAVLEIEEIVIRIRAPKREDIGDYGYERQAAADTSVSEWLRTRVHPRIEGYEVCVIDGYWNEPHGRTRLRNLRDSYDR